MKRGSKKGYEFGFAWIFTIFIGAVVIFLAVYIATQIVGMKQLERESVRGKKIGVLLTPIETELEAEKFATILVPDETMLFNGCDPPQSLGNPFGSQHISTSIKSSIGGKWDVKNEQGVKSTFHNKYLFSNQSLHGKEEFYVLSKPFNLPFKVADLLMLWPDQEKYCFVGFPDYITNELMDLNMANIILSPPASCPPEAKKVCFGSSCTIRVDIDTFNNKGTVTKEGKTLPYIESFSSGTNEFTLMYAAIFSDPEIYECQVKRLMAHAEQLADIYLEKRKNIGCSPILQNPLNQYKSAVSTAADNFKINEPTAATNYLNNVYAKAGGLEIANNVQCNMF